MLSHVVIFTPEFVYTIEFPNQHHVISTADFLEGEDNESFSINKDTSPTELEEKFMEVYGKKITICMEDDFQKYPNSFVYKGGAKAFFYNIDLADEKECHFLGQLMKQLFCKNRIF